LIDYAADGSPLGIEIISPGVVTEEEINAAFERLGVEPPSMDERSAARGVAGTAVIDHSRWVCDGFGY